jgi:hypothetical protein
MFVGARGFVCSCQLDCRVLGDQLRQPAEEDTSKRLERLINLIEAVEGRTDPIKKEERQGQELGKLLPFVRRSSSV